MSWKRGMAQAFLRTLSPRDFEDVACSATVQMVDRMGQEEELDFFRRFVEEHLAPLLAGLERADRAALMNALLLTLAREFPLADLDILGAFSATGDPWAKVDEEA